MAPRTIRRLAPGARRREPAAFFDCEALRMRSTRATAAVARLNERSPGRHYLLVLTSGGRFKLRERGEGGEQTLCEDLALDDFVRFVDALGPQKALRVTKNDAAFARQLQRRAKAPEAGDSAGGERPGKAPSK